VEEIVATRPITTSSFAGIFALFFMASAAVGRAQEVVRVSLDSNGVEGNWGSGSSVLSADGRYVVFTSWATNFVASDTNDWIDIFVRDRVAGTTERVSVDSNGAEGILGDWEFPVYTMAISTDGNIVAFDSDFVNLVANDTNGMPDVFIHDRTSGITERVSVDPSGTEGDAGGQGVTMSADGRYVCFGSGSTNLVPGDTNGTGDVFVHDRSTGITERISVDSSGSEGNGNSGESAISADGRFVAFTSWASNLVAGDTNGIEDIFVRDLAAGTTERVTVDSSGLQANGVSRFPSISSDGGCVAFVSGADNLVAGDRNKYWDAFVRDRSAGTTERASVHSSGHEGDNSSNFPSISGDGSLVAFQSYADNLVPGDTNASGDVFLRDRFAQTTTLISRNAFGDLGNLSSGTPSFSSDGKNVSFYSDASNLIPGDTNSEYDIFVCMLDRVKSHWIHYGAGWPGTNGTPSITPSADPTFGTTISLTVGNSLGATTDALVVIGTRRTQVPSVWGGELLVEPFLVMPVVLDAGGFTTTGDVPNDPSLFGFVLDLQALELDGGASRGVSFTDGLELVLGD
jgi:Tol biopolymer transport system component